ncbi:YciI family protein [Tumebacillus permanentifrigoris]|uniref:Uncharacterized protein YciI n=1 Tax=Tumebacillus permanentifrigoris TaxID=378543 RepID=A0A316DAL9_9BACL|nr:YciI family protein [Tumebacillus permanentifrigoris]PWK14842.1 uncharacterized protein YciI [Tumebacillus permanentifrigoris]
MGTSEYIYLIRPIRPEFREKVLESELEILNTHFAYLQKLVETGTCLLAGPCLDRAFGIVVLRVDTPEQAQEIMENDPAIKFGVMSAELHPFRVALLAEQQ